MPLNIANLTHIAGNELIFPTNTLRTTAIGAGGATANSLSLEWADATPGHADADIRGAMQALIDAANDAVPSSADAGVRPDISLWRLLPEHAGLMGATSDPAKTAVLSALALRAPVRRDDIAIGRIVDNDSFTVTVADALVWDPAPAGGGGAAMDTDAVNALADYIEANAATLGLAKLQLLAGSPRVRASTDLVGAIIKCTNFNPAVADILVWNATGGVVDPNAITAVRAAIAPLPEAEATAVLQKFAAAAHVRQNDGLVRIILENDGFNRDVANILVWDATAGAGGAVDAAAITAINAAFTAMRAAHVDTTAPLHALASAGHVKHAGDGVRFIFQQAEFDDLVAEDLVLDPTTRAVDPLSVTAIENTFTAGLPGSADQQKKVLVGLARSSKVRNTTLVDDIIHSAQFDADVAEDLSQNEVGIRRIVGTIRVPAVGPRTLTADKLHALSEVAEIASRPEIVEPILMHHALDNTTVQNLMRVDNQALVEAISNAGTLAPARINAILGYGSVNHASAKAAAVITALGGNSLIDNTCDIALNTAITTAVAHFNRAYFKNIKDNIEALVVCPASLVTINAQLPNAVFSSEREVDEVARQIVAADPSLEKRVEDACLDKANMLNVTAEALMLPSYGLSLEKKRNITKASREMSLEDRQAINTNVGRLTGWW